MRNIWLLLLRGPSTSLKFAHKKIKLYFFSFFVTYNIVQTRVSVNHVEGNERNRNRKLNIHENDTDQDTPITLCMHNSFQQQHIAQSVGVSRRVWTLYSFPYCAILQFSYAAAAFIFPSVSTSRLRDARKLHKVACWRMFRSQSNLRAYLHKSFFLWLCVLLLFFFRVLVLLFLSSKWSCPMRIFSRSFLLI